MNRRETFIDSIVIVIISLAVAICIVSDLFGFFSIDSTEEGTNTLMSDIYYRVADNQSIQTLNSDIVIIGMDDCNRNDIAALVDAVSYSGAKVIGLDVLFNIPSGANDDLLISTIDACDNIVLPLRVSYDSEENIFSSPKGSFFYDELSNAHYGVVNFPFNKTSVARDFKPFFEVADTCINSFAATICRLYDPKSFAILKERNKSHERINYSISEYMEYDAFEIIDGERFPREGIEDLLRDKIVLIGGLEAEEDQHITPVEYNMPGVKIHAKIIDTIIGDNYIRESNKFVEILISLLSCVLFVYLNLMSKHSEKEKKVMSKVKSLMIRFVQLILIYIFLLIGCHCFVKRHILINFSYALLMLANAAMIMDIWLGTKAFYVKKSVFGRLYRIRIKHLILHNILHRK